jgi:hypothetical protein
LLLKKKLNLKLGQPKKKRKILILGKLVRRKKVLKKNLLKKNSKRIPIQNYLNKLIN